MEFAPLVVLKILTCYFGLAHGASLKIRSGPGTLLQLPNGSLQLDANSTLIAQPAPRFPLECNECKEYRKTGGVVSCSGMNSACRCCKAIFEDKTAHLCKQFEKPLGKPYTKLNGKHCLNTIEVAMEQRSEMCDAAYSYDQPLKDIAPKRFGDTCNGTRPDLACGDDMCSMWGCNGELRKAEQKYRDVEHWWKVYDEHPCKVAEQRNLKKGKAFPQPPPKAQKVQAEKADKAEKAGQAEEADDNAAEEKIAEEKVALPDAMEIDDSDREPQEPQSKRSRIDPADV